MLPAQANMKCVMDRQIDRDKEVIHKIFHELQIFKGFPL